MLFFCNFVICCCRRRCNKSKLASKGTIERVFVLCSNQDAILCSECNCWSHARCLHMSKAGFLYYLENPSIEWACSLCSLTQLTVSDGECSVSDAGSTGDTDSDFASADIVDFMSWYQSNINTYYKFNLKIAYLNINSLINKVDEVKEMLSRNMFDILFIAETKIDGQCLFLASLTAGLQNSS